MNSNLSMHRPPRLPDLPPESEICQYWENPQVVVSICCGTYNHGPFIADALGSFLMQKTNFAFEILVHDDASTDNTADLVRSYERLYPNLISAIYQTENQRSQGKKAAGLNYDRAEGKYIALCEGDDFWISPNKLQIQFGLMQKDNSISLTFHAAYSGDQFLGAKKMAHHSKETVRFGLKNIIMNGPGCIPSASMMYRPCIYHDLRANYLRSISPAGDMVTKFILPLRGKVIFIAGIHSFYRTDVPSSWSVRNKRDMGFRAEVLRKMMEFVYEFRKDLPIDLRYIYVIRSIVLVSLGYYRLARSGGGEDAFLSLDKLRYMKFLKPIMFISIIWGTVGANLLGVSKKGRR